MMILRFVSVILCAVTLAAGASTDTDNTTLASDNGTSHIEDPSGNTAQPDASTDMNRFHFRRAQLNCLCGENPKRMWRQKIEPETAELYYRARDNATLGFLMKQYSFLEDRNCTKCTIHYVTCHGADETYYYNCIRRHLKISRMPRTFFIERSDSIRKKRFVQRSSLRISDKEIGGGVNNFYFDLDPIATEIPSKIANSKKTGSQKKNPIRVRRTSGACVIPTDLDQFQSDFRCSYEEKKKLTQCLQRCAWGHTLPSGITQVLRCSDYSSNIWEPHGIRSCESFVDCKIGLVSPGSLICTPITIEEGPTCKISCEHYEDKDGVPEDTYTCDINGKWDKKFPFCVARSTALVLVEPPNKKLHGDIGKEFVDSLSSFSEENVIKKLSTVRN